jgi:hypothetical protein
VSRRFELVSRLLIVVAGLAWALAGSQVFLVDLARLTPVRKALLGLLPSLMFSCALWLSGFGVCRGLSRWCVALILIAFLGRGMFLTGAAPVVIDSLGIGLAAALFTVLATVAPAALGTFLVLMRPPRTLLLLERLASKRPSPRAAA